LPQVNIAQIYLPVFFAELQQHFIKLIQLLRGSIGLNGNIIIRNSSRQSNAVANISAQLQIQLRVEDRILAVSYTKASPKTAIVSKFTKVEKRIICRLFTKGKILLCNKIIFLCYQNCSDVPLHLAWKEIRGKKLQCCLKKFFLP